MEVRENHKALPQIDYEKALSLVQKEYEKVHYEVKSYNHPIWEKLESIRLLDISFKCTL